MVADEKERQRRNDKVRKEHNNPDFYGGLIMAKSKKDKKDKSKMIEKEGEDPYVLKPDGTKVPLTDKSIKMNETSEPSKTVKEINIDKDDTLVLASDATGQLNLDGEKAEYPITSVDDIRRHYKFENELCSLSITDTAWKSANPKNRQEARAVTQSKLRVKPDHLITGTEYEQQCNAFTDKLIEELHLAEPVGVPIDG